jgi:glycosyltransferase involved in cell wall biosynthesis
MNFDVSLISEASYPTGTGGVSEWCHSLITGMNEVKFNIYSLSSENKLRYRLPVNVGEVVTENLHSPEFKRGIEEKYAKELFNQLIPVLTGSPLDCDKILKVSNKCEFEADELLGSDVNWNTAIAYYGENFEGKPFTPFYIFWTSLFYLLFKILEVVDQVPTANIYHTLNAGYAGLLGCLSKVNTGGSLIVTEHGLYLKERKFELENSEIPIWLHGMYEKFFESLIRTSYNYSDVITYVCENHTQYQRENDESLEKTRIIYNGIDTQKFQNLDSKQTEDNGCYTIGTVTRITPIKDVLTLIRSAKYVLEKHDAIYYIIGDVEDDEYFEECQELVDKMKINECIRFTGYQDSMEWYPKFDVFALPSLSEGFPLSILEALSFEVPCVATEVGGVPEILAEKFLVQKWDPVGLAERINWLLENQDERRRIGVEGRKRVEKRFSLDKMIKEYRELYGELI